MVNGYSIGHLVLGDDLAELLRVYAVDAPFGTILCSARILEGLASAALEALGLAPSANLLSNLQTLDSLDLLPQTTRYWSNALRRLGNQARHVLRRVGSGDALLGLIFLERWLGWFFLEFAFGPRFHSLTLDGNPLRLAGDGPLARTVEHFDSAEFDPVMAANALAAERDDLRLSTSTIPALLAEMLIDRGQNKSAEDVLRDALGRYPNEIRLRQLAGINCKRAGDLEGALAWLQPLAAESVEDSETTGPLAAVYKELWARNPTERQWLEKSYRAYSDGYRRRREPYLGVNAATTAFLLDREEESRELATDVRNRLRKRFEAVAALGVVLPGYWNLVTLAELEFLLRNITEAQRLYLQAYSTYPQLAGARRVTESQAGWIAAKLDVPNPA